MSIDDTDFWSARPVLGYIEQLARARRAGPWATLAAAMGRAITTVPTTVVLPGIIGGRMSLNAFFALVGPSGGGKGAAEAAAAAGIRFSTGHIEPTPLGSGEGLARTYRPSGTKPDEPNPVTTALFSAPEVDSLAALAARTGSTLSAELRKVYSGETIGFANSQAHTRNIVAAGSYRAVLVVGVQPLRSDALLGAADGGLPQRFLWAPVSDRDAPDSAPVDPGVWEVNVPAWARSRPTGEVPVIDDHIHDLGIPDVAVAEIREHRLAVLREDSGVDPFDGHRLLTRLKAAAALMALDGRTLVSDEDWVLSGVLMEISAQTRDMCRQAMQNHARTINTARALASADRDDIVSDSKLRRAKEAVIRWLRKSGETAASDLRKKLKADLRGDFSAAIAELAADGRVKVIDTERGTRYRLADVVHPCTESTPQNAQLSSGVPEYTGVPAVDNRAPHNACSDQFDRPADPFGAISEHPTEDTVNTAHSAQCRICYVLLPTAATGDLCDEHIDGNTPCAQPAATCAAPAIPVHSGAIAKREAQVSNRPFYEVIRGANF